MCNCPAHKVNDCRKPENANGDRPINNDLLKAADTSYYVIFKMTVIKHIAVECVGEICKALSYTPNDIIEFVFDSD